MKDEIGSLREWIAKISVELLEFKQFQFATTPIIIALLGLILYKVW